MKKIFLISVVFFALVLSIGARANQATDQILKSLSWVEGPKVVSVGSNASFTVPPGYLFLGAADTKRFMEEVTQNPSSGQEYFFGPADGSWWATFQYQPTGHVPDDEKIDASALIASMRANQDTDNQNRKAKGWPTLNNMDWKYPPFYDAGTKRLDWAISFVNSGTNSLNINYETRILGREGVTSATLVVGPQQLDKAVGEFKSVVAGYEFVQGQRYSEFKQGDRVAEYGLAALVAGGTTAVLAKAGFFAKFWKVIVGAGAALVAGIGGLFGRKNKS